MDQKSPNGLGLRCLFIGECVLSGVNKERISYDELSVTKRATDVCCTIKEEKKYGYEGTEVGLFKSSIAL